ncbi:hypothetical protein SSCG_00855 [Streptomyces clavuligerus]|nr:hypothetical protein SSCG_00855 [Streptomyces clavuligerus]
MSTSSTTTANVRKWYFTLHLQEKLTEEQADTIDGLDRFTDGRISRVEGLEDTEFSCLFGARLLTDAIAEALGLFEDFPGVLIRSVEVPSQAMWENGMATPAVVPAPPPL